MAISHLINGSRGIFPSICGAPIRRGVSMRPLLIRGAWRPGMMSYMQRSSDGSLSILINQHPQAAALRVARGAFPAIQAAVSARGEKVVVLDDDPTGTQTIHDIPVLTEWPIEALCAELANDLPAF